MAHPVSPGPLSPDADRPPGDAPWRADGRSLGFALAGTFVLRCASYAAGIIIVVSLGLKSRTDSDVTAGLAALVAVTFYGAELIGAPIFGVLSDRYGRKLFILLGPVFGAIAIQLLGWTAIIPVLVLVRVLEGLSTASSAPATLGYLSAETAGSERLRGRVMGFYEAATVVGLALGAAVGGKLYEQFAGWAFSLVAVIYILALVLFVFVRDRPAVAAPHIHWAEVFRRLANPRIMRFAPAWLAANAVLGAWLSVGPFLASGLPDPSQRLMGGFSPGQIGGAFMIFGALFTGGAIAWGFILPRLGRQGTLMWGVMGLGGITVALWLLNQGTTQRPTILVLAVIVGVFVMSGFTPAALAYLAEIAEEQAERRGSVMGLYSVLLSVGQLLGGALAGPFAQRWGMNGLILLTGLLFGVAWLTVYLLGQAEQRRAHRIPTEEPTRTLAARFVLRGQELVQAAPGLARRYGVAAAASLIALLLAQDLYPLGESIPFPLFLAAVMVSAWYGGLGPGLLATAAGALAVDYFFQSPTHSLAIASLSTAVELLMFVLAAFLISSLHGGLRAAGQRAEASLAKTVAAHDQVTRVLTRLGDGVFAVDRQWRLTYLTPPAAVTLQPGADPAPATALIGRRLWEVLATPSPAFAAGLHAAMIGQAAVELEECWPEVPRRVAFHVYPVEDGLLVLCRDVTACRDVSEDAVSADASDDDRAAPTALTDALAEDLAAVARTLDLLRREDGLPSSVYDHTARALAHLDAAARRVERFHTRQQPADHNGHAPNGRPPAPGAGEHPTPADASVDGGPGAASAVPRADPLDSAEQRPR